MTDITPTSDGYTGPAIHLRWQHGVAVATADDPGLGAWVLVPASLLLRLAVATRSPYGDRALAWEAEALIRGTVEQYTACPDFLMCSSDMECYRLHGCVSDLDGATRKETSEAPSRVARQ